MPRSPLQNIKRRGAAYWWRRTISLASLAFSEKFSISLEFSLFTKDLDHARGRAAAMTAYSERLKMSFRENVAQIGLDEQTISALFIDEVRSYRNELVHLEAAWKAHPVWSRVSTRDTDLGVFEALWTGIAREGLGVPRDWDFVEKHFSEFDPEMQANIRSLLREHGDLPESLRLAAQARLDGLGARANAVTIPVAVDVIARARAEAARRVRGNVDFDDLANLASLAANLARTQGNATFAPSTANAISSTPLLPTTQLDAKQQRYAEMTPTEFVDIFIEDTFAVLDHRSGSKRQRAIVGDPTYRDMRWIALLLEKSLPPGLPLSKVNAENVKVLDGWFDRLPTTIGKSPNDRKPETTLEMIEKQALDRIEAGELVGDAIGLSASTTNKHWHNFSRIHEHLRTLVPGIEPVSVARYITPDIKSKREGRQKYTVEQGEAIFRLPPWTGCTGLSNRLEAGTKIIHDALYFVLLLVWYTGARREEICKLKIDDVFGDEEVPYLYVRESDIGRIKSLNAKRKIPLHSELLRLGFLDYVTALQQVGETLVFPELYPAPGTKRALGDVFYKIWWIYIRPLVPDLKRGQAMHAARHTVSDALKQAGITLEERNDVLGHSQEELGEGASTYSEPVELKRMKDMVEVIPKVTGHLPAPMAINLLPPELRVERPARAKREA